jgi:hypothetical protein
MVVVPAATAVMVTVAWPDALVVPEAVMVATPVSDDVKATVCPELATPPEVTVAVAVVVAPAAMLDWPRARATATVPVPAPGAHPTTDASGKARARQVTARIRTTWVVRNRSTSFRE